MWVCVWMVLIYTQHLLTAEFSSASLLNAFLYVTLVVFVVVLSQVEEISLVLRHCAWCVALCCVLKATAARLSWRVRMSEPVLPTPLSVELGLAFSSG